MTRANRAMMKLKRDQKRNLNARNAKAGAFWSRSDGPTTQTTSTQKTVQNAKEQEKRNDTR